MTRTKQLEARLADLIGQVVRVRVPETVDVAGVEASAFRVEFTTTTGVDDASSFEQTALLLADPLLDLPQFMLRPERGQMFAFDILWNLDDIDFEDSPAFSRAYYLHGWNPEPVRVLFGTKVREHFAERPGWTVYGRGRHVFITQFGDVHKGEAFERFIESATEILTVLREGVRELDARPGVERGFRPDHMLEALPRIRGRSGKRFLKHLRRIVVPREHLLAYLRSEPPRRVPPRLARQVVGENTSTAACGFILALFGGIFGWAMLTHAEGKQAKMGGVVMAFSLIIGLPTMIVPIWTRWSRARPLRRSEWCDGRVESVTPYISSDDVVWFSVDIAFTFDGEERTGRCRTCTPVVARAFELLDSGEATRILVNPRDPRHVICPELLLQIG